MLLASQDSLTLLDYVSRIGVVAMLVVILYGGWKQWWVFGWQYKQVVQEKEEWKIAALKAATFGESAARVGEHLVARGKALRDEA